MEDLIKTIHRVDQRDKEQSENPSFSSTHGTVTNDHTVDHEENFNKLQ